MELMEPPFTNFKIFDMHDTKLLKVCGDCRHKYFVNLDKKASEA